MAAPAGIPPSLVAQLHRQANASRWRVTAERFAAVLERSLDHAGASDRWAAQDPERYLSALHLADLALACACSDGDERAWDHLVRELRPVLYRAADAIDPTGGARELADSLYGELFGATARDGVRQSLFRYFHGRSSLATWLRAVLAQRHVDRIRAARRLEPLPDEQEVASGRLTGPDERTAPTSDPARPRFLHAMERALSEAIGGLEARDRLRLKCYYTQDLTLAAIGRLLGEHEATVSRHLTRTRRSLRDAVERHLRDECRLDAAAIAECFRSVAADAGAIDLAQLLDDSDRKNPPADRSKDV